MQPDDIDRLLTPSEVAALFRVDPKTVSRWAKAGRVSAIRTPGGHRRFRAAEIAMLRGLPADNPPAFPVVDPAGRAADELDVVEDDLEAAA